jgi:hypothetical protein
MLTLSWPRALTPNRVSDLAPERVSDLVPTVARPPLDSLRVALWPPPPDWFIVAEPPPDDLLDPPLWLADVPLLAPVPDFMPESCADTGTAKASAAVVARASASVLICSSE